MTPVPMPCKALNSVIDGSSSPGARLPDWMASASISVTCCAARRRSRVLTSRAGTFAVLGERPAGAGQVAAALQPRVQLVEDGTADLPYLQVPQSGLDAALGLSITPFYETFHADGAQ
jgi:hypothetical protein